MSERPRQVKRQKAKVKTSLPVVAQALLPVSVPRASRPCRNCMAGMAMAQSGSGSAAPADVSAVES